MAYCVFNNCTKSMMKSINVIINDALFEGISQEDEVSKVSKQHVVQNVPKNNTNILLPRVDNNTKMLKEVLHRTEVHPSIIQLRT